MILPISQTATFNDLFTKLNEVISLVNTQNSSIGDLTSLTTLSRSDLVSAINEKGESLALQFILEE